MICLWIIFPSGNQWTAYLQQAGVTNSKRSKCKRKTTHKNMNKQNKIIRCATLNILKNKLYELQPNSRYLMGSICNTGNLQKF